MDWDLDGACWVAVDADFEHARLLKIHTSVVVSARSVIGFSVFWASNIAYKALCARGWFKFLLILLLAEIPHDYITLYLYSQWIPTITFDVASEVAAVVYIFYERSI